MYSISYLIELMTRGPVWKQLFTATWRGFQLRINAIKENLRRHKSLIQSQATLAQFEEAQKSHAVVLAEFERIKAEDTDRRRIAVLQWLDPFDSEVVHEKYLEVRAENPNSGSWLLKEPKFLGWYQTDACKNPLLGLNGIPGAGKPHGCPD